MSESNMERKIDISKIVGVSYAGDPRDNTLVYISKKVEHLLDSFEERRGCLIIVEEGVYVSESIQNSNTAILCENPQLKYAELAATLWDKYQNSNRLRQYKITDKGYYVGENVTIGEESYIEPGVVIGHDVKIGHHATLLSGCIIKRAVLGDYVLVNECAVIGSNGFTFTDDLKGNKIRIPTLGGVIIGNHVEIGAHDNISCGTAGNTIIEDYVKLDSLVHVGHDDLIRKNSEITSGTILGGYDEIGEHVFMGLNSSAKNRIKIDDGCKIDMGAVIVRSVGKNKIMFGNPGREILTPKVKG